MLTGPTEQILHRRLDLDGPEPAIQIAEHVADIADEDVDSLSSTWETFGDVLADLFADPPARDAQVQVTFTYEGYRITVEQDGHAKFVPITDPSA